MILVQVSIQAGDGGALLVYGLMILVVFLVQVAILRWIIRVNDVVTNQEDMINLLRELARQRQVGEAVCTP